MMTGNPDCQTFMERHLGSQSEFLEIVGWMTYVGRWMPQGYLCQLASYRQIIVPFLFHPRDYSGQQHDCRCAALMPHCLTLMLS